MNSLLIKPLYRAGITTVPRLLRPLLQLLIGGQWMLAVGSCVLQDWSSLLISFWLAFCVCASTYAYPPESGVQDWLQYHCNLSITHVQAEFSSRRSMLSAMLYLNPDSKERRTDWITPLLAAPMIVMSGSQRSLIACIRICLPYSFAIFHTVPLHLSTPPRRVS